jgi:hypothetical protein
MTLVSEKRALLRHFLAALAYRTTKALRDAPPWFGSFQAGRQIRTPAELVRHMASVLGYARTHFIGGTYRAEPLSDLGAEVSRFHQMLEDLGDHLDRGTPLLDTTEERLLQGPLADAMTHVGQLAMLRRLAGSPVPPENFIVAAIESDHLGSEQPNPVSPDRDWPEALAAPPAAEFDLAAGLAILERTPAAVRAMLAGLPPAWTDATEGSDTWSPFVIVGHLIHGERTDWISRARIILAQGASRRFTPYDRFAQFRDSQGKSLGQLLDEFGAIRAENLATLAGWKLTDERLDLTGEHPAFGSVTLRQLLSTWVAHDLGHVAQMARVMAKQYRTAVGPWRAYLPILDR